MAEAMRDLQKKRIAGEIGDTLIFVEHPEVVTIGPKAVRDGFDVKGYPTSITDRGGGITWHGPGQLVVYPIVKWGVHEQSVRGIIERLEDWAIDALLDCGISAYKDDSMQGAWVDGHKICSIGLSFLHWVSRHGMSINVDTPGSRVEELEGCGMKAGVHTSLARLGTIPIKTATLSTSKGLRPVCESFARSTWEGSQQNQWSGCRGFSHEQATEVEPGHTLASGPRFDLPEPWLIWSNAQ